MRFWRRRETEAEPDPDVLEWARALLGDDPAVAAAEAHPGDPAVLNRLVAVLNEHAWGDLEEDIDDERQEDLAAAATGLLVVKLALQGLSPDEIRGWSLAELAHHGLAAPPEHFPTILEAYAGPRRSTQEVVDRTRALHAVLAAAFGHPADEIRASLTERGLLPWLSDQERALLEDPDNEDLRVQISWRSECLRALGWALQIYDSLPLDGVWEPAPEDFAVIDPEAAAGVPADVDLRPERELMARVDVFYCAHWAVRNHELTGQPEDFPEEIAPGAVWERRHALEWLLSDTDWDEISLDT